MVPKERFELPLMVYKTTVLSFILFWHLMVWSITLRIATVTYLHFFIDIERFRRRTEILYEKVLMVDPVGL